MNSYRYEERVKSHANASRLREDVRLTNKDDEPRRGGSNGDGYRRGRGGLSSHACESESERKVHLNRYNEGLIVCIPNDHYQNPNSVSSSNRRGQFINNNGTSGTRPQGPLRSSLRSSNNGYSADGRNQPRIRFDTSERKRNRSFREYSDNSAPHTDWKPDASGIPMESRYNGGQPRQNTDNRGLFNSAWASGDWNRNSSLRRSGRRNEGSSARGDDGSFRSFQRRRGGGGAGDGVVVSFRVPEDENPNDRDHRIGDRSRIGGLRRRGSMRGSRGGRRGGGSWRGTADIRSASKPRNDDNSPDLEKHSSVGNPEDNNSTDDDQYQLSVDVEPQSKPVVENELEILEAEVASGTASEFSTDPTRRELKTEDVFEEMPSHNSYQEEKEESTSDLIEMQMGTDSDIPFEEPRRANSEEVKVASSELRNVGEIHVLEARCVTTKEIKESKEEVEQKPTPLDLTQSAESDDNLANQSFGGEKCCGPIAVKDSNDLSNPNLANDAALNTSASVTKSTSEVDKLPTENATVGESL